MALIDTSDVADAASFRRRLVPCVARVAGIVRTETPSGRMRVDEKRNELARQALRDPRVVSELFVWGVLSNDVIASAGISASDADLQYQVTQIWSTIAAVTAAEEAEEPLAQP